MSLSKLAWLLILVASVCLGQGSIRANGGLQVNGGLRTGPPSGGGGGITPPSLEDNLYCNSSNTWIGGASDATALLPTRCLYTAVAGTPAPLGQLQATITNSSSPTPMAAFESELTNAVCGEIIYIAPGTLLQSASATDLTFPSKGCDNAHWIWIASTAINLSSSAFPPPGQRITPCFNGVAVSSPTVLQWPLHNGNCGTDQMATFMTTNAQVGTFTFAPGADHYRFMGVKFARPSGAFGYSLVSAVRNSSGTDTYVVNGDLSANVNVQVGQSVNIAQVVDKTFDVNQTITSITLPSTFTTQQNGKPAVSSNGGMMSQVFDLSSIVTFTPDAVNGQHHIIFDRVLVEGTPDTETKSGIQLGDSNTVAIIDSWLDEIHCYDVVGACVDSKPIAGALTDNPSAGNYKIVNNFLEASGQGTFFGGGAATVVPTDMEQRRNWFFKPAAWNPLDAPNYNGGGPPPTGYQPFNVKNGRELKNFIRVLMEGNVTTRVFITSDQRADGIVLSPKSQAGAGGSNLCPICQVTDITIRYERGSLMGRGLQIADIASDNGGLATAGGDYSIHDLVFDDIGDPLTGSQSPQMFEIAGISQLNLFKVTLNHLTFVSDFTALMVTMGGPPKTWVVNSPVNAGDPRTPCQNTSPCTYTDPPTIFVALNSGTTSLTSEPPWPARLSSGTVNDNGIIWQEDSAHLNLYLMDQVVIKNSIFSTTAGDGIHTTGGGNTNCVNETGPNPTIARKLDACMSNYTFGPNVLYGGNGLTWPTGNIAMSSTPAAWKKTKVTSTGTAITATTATNPLTVFVAQNSGTTGLTEPVWPTRLSAGTVDDNGIMWLEQSQLYPANGNSLGMVSYDGAIGGDYRFCTGIGVPDVSCTIGSPYAANGTNHADDGDAMGSHVDTVNTKTSGVDTFQ